MKFKCMYTKHKTQKRKVYHDGSVEFVADGAVLRDERGRVVGRGDWEGERKAGEEGEMEGFLVDVEGPLGVPSQGGGDNEVRRIEGIKFQGKRESGMEKLIGGRKFKKPKAYTGGGTQRAGLGLGRGVRRPPIQPGEIGRRDGVREVGGGVGGIEGGAAYESHGNHRGEGQICKKDRGGGGKGS